MQLNDLITLIEARKKIVEDISKREENFFQVIIGLDIDLNRYTKYHVAGTNGKGSTVKYLSEMLKRSNRMVGSFLSPYVYNFNERIMIKNEPISNSLLKESIEEVLNYADLNNIPLAFFEIMFITSLVVFKKMFVEDIVIETGVGGLYDVTNFIKYDYALITNISKDHQNVLGKSLKKIYLNKLGIFKPATKLITTMTNYLSYTKSYAKNISSEFILISPKDITIIKESPLKFKYLDYNFILGDRPKYEINNFILALACFNITHKLDNSILQDIFSNTKLLGCFEYIKNNIIFDGAHNEGALLELRKELSSKNIKNPVLIYSILEGKDYKANIKVLNKISKNQFYCLFPDKRLLDPTIFKGYFRAEVFNYHDINNIISDSNKTYIVCGSIHLLSKLKYLIK